MYSQVVQLLDKRDIKVSSVDFVRFTWLNREEQEKEEQGDEGDEEEPEEDDKPYTQPIEDGTRSYTNPTIWIGVLPDTLSSAIARESSMDIRDFLGSLHVRNIDIAYRESVYQILHGRGPALFLPAGYFDPLKDVIDNVSVALSLPIADYKTTIHGTLGSYFHAGGKLYAITTRHMFFDIEKDNESYRYNGAFSHSRLLFKTSKAIFLV